MTTGHMFFNICTGGLDVIRQFVIY